jgi:hypothetical protein
MATMTTRQDIPPEIAAIVDWCLMKEPAQRAPNVAEIARRLGPFCPPRVFPTIDRISAVMHVAPAALGGSPLAATRTDPSLMPSFAASGPARASSDSLPQHTPPPVQHAQTSAGWGATAPGNARGSAAAWIAVGIGAAVVLSGAVAGAVAWTHHSDAASSSATQPATATAPAEAPSALPAAAPPASAAEPMPPNTAAAEPVAPPPLASTPPATPATPPPVARAPVSPARPAAASPARPAPRPAQGSPAGTPKPNPTLAIPDTSK